MRDEASLNVETVLDRTQSAVPENQSRVAPVAALSSIVFMLNVKSCGSVCSVYVIEHKNPVGIETYATEYFPNILSQ